MRAPTRSTRRPVRHGLPVGLAAAALALAGAAPGPAPSATASPTDVQLIVNGGFDSLPWIWDCDPNTARSTVPHEHFVTGRPTADDYAGCTQRVRVQPNSSYTLSASVRGPYVFVGASGTGTGTGSVATWSNGSDWNDLSVQVVTGADTTELTVHFHGWYGQGPYDVRRMSFTGPGVAPGPCGEAGTVPPAASDGPASPSPSPGCSRTYFP